MPIFTRSGYAEPGTSLNFKTGTWRIQKPFHKHRSAPCHSACPAGEDAQAYIAQMQAGHCQSAWEVLVEANPLPAVTARVCPHPCESACNRAQFDSAVTIHAIERFLGDQAITKEWAYPIQAPAAEAATIAVIGAGPAGLSAAYHALRLGYKACIFDEHSEAGGTLRTAIPAYRLPRDILDAEIGRLLALPGIRFEARKRLGRDMDLRELQQDYAAVFLGTGAQRGSPWDIDGATPTDLHSGLDLLKEWVDIGTLSPPESVAVIGAGNTAIDTARIMKRAGARDVHVISHKPIPRPGIPPEEAMPAIAREVYEALEEGVIIHEHRGIRRLILRGERVTGVELVHMKKLMQPGGRMKRVAFEGTESVLHVDQVIPAVGQVIDPAGYEHIAEQQRHIKVDPWGRINGHPGIFAGGDVTPNEGTVTAAIGDGRRAALAINSQLKKQDLPEIDDSPPLEHSALNLNYYEKAPAAQEPALPVHLRKSDEEITATLSQPVITKETQRCFSCGNCLACDNCWTLCPDSAVLKTTENALDASHYVFDYDYCKGCGICARECPCGYIEMAEDFEPRGD